MYLNVLVFQVCSLLNVDDSGKKAMPPAILPKNLRETGCVRRISSAEKLGVLGLQRLAWLRPVELHGEGSIKPTYHVGPHSLPFWASNQNGYDD